MRSVLERTAQSANVRWAMGLDDMVRVVLSIIIGISLRWQIYRDDDEANDLLHRAVDLVVRDARPLDGA